MIITSEETIYPGVCASRALYMQTVFKDKYLNTEVARQIRFIFNKGGIQEHSVHRVGLTG